MGRRRAQAVWSCGRNDTYIIGVVCLTRKRFFSLRLPFGIYVHYAKGRKIGESRPAYSKGLVHCNRRKQIVVKTVRSFFGEPNHYDPQGRCVGYSRRTKLGRVTHYDRNGKIIGYSTSILGILYITRLLNSIIKGLRYTNSEGLSMKASEIRIVMHWH